MFENKKKGIVFFDIDDTLVDTTEFMKVAFSQAIIAVMNFDNFTKKYPKLTFECLLERYNYYYLENKNAPDHYHKLFSSFGKLTPKEIETYTLVAIDKRKKIKKTYHSYIRKGIKNVFIWLKKNNYSIGIISNGIEHKQIDKLELLGLIEYIDRNKIFTTSKIKNEVEIRNFKKDESSYLKIFNYFKISNDYQMWMIGDKESEDILPAKEAGFQTIRVNCGKYAKDAKINGEYPIISKKESDEEIDLREIIEIINNPFNHKK